MAAAMPNPGAVPGQQDQPPFGSTSAVGPTPNRGLEAAGLQKLGSVLKQLEELVPLLGTSTDAGRACLDALSKLAKHVPAGSVTPASERNNLEQMAMRNTQQNQMMQAVKQQRAGGPPGGQAAPPGA